MTKIKLCGLSRTEDIEAVNQLLPDFMGFVFYEKSVRNVSLDRAKELKALLDSRIKAVGVFVDEDPEFIKKLSSENVIDIIQLHGSEDEAYVENIKAATGRPVIQAFKVKEPQDVEKANNSKADYILLDSGMGTGKPFNWELLQGIKRDYFLAGGLFPENVKEAIETVKPYAVDVSSGIETDKKKDVDKMRRFVDNVRNAAG
ncbi:phosphoribosylanthranilate isomerase [Butyrivibrio sp. MC2021]|uniref:phosphoribosylanthranilate isomerase n=1 Tax=Butyrivibrio sp. MC2021 TaxID=1408306 RepID=UPI0004791F24|nr:phosphoribosylanthranilate isomerase [Butyrivibrio sp. MC2021]